ncbi:MAG: cobyric acid synthase [Eubacterium sp.]|nr:cobyric acid synthase [Eubacterium sp.]
MSDNQGIRAEKLNIGYKSDLIRDISFSVQPGKIVTLIGPNGCGKTTLLKTLTGELAARGGVIYIDGTDKQSLKASEIAKCMSLVMTYKIKPELMTCREVVEIGRYPYTGRLGILSENDREKVEEAMKWTDISELGEKLFSDISDGQKQRVLLARAICQEPKILILDEPTSFLDIMHKIDILQKIRDYVKEKNIAVLMSLHELEIARNISDIIVAMGEGEIQKIGTPREVFSERFIRKLYHIEGMNTELLGNMPWYEDSDDAESPLRAEGLKASDDSQNNGKAKVIMIQGTMSNAGKSVIAAGLCRIFSDDGYRVAPFKSQNMALNSYITKEGLEMGRAQVMQAECARIEPMTIMNPILLKPTSDTGSQVIVNGKVVGNMKAMEYFRHKKDYIKDIRDAYDRIADMVDIIVVEGAGSPVEMNLKEDDIVNMGLAEMLDAPVLLVGDIDRGGIFPQLLGTLDLFEENERKRVKGLIVNKFRGDSRLFEDGVKILEERGKTKVVGVVPFLKVSLDDEDSLSDRFEKREAKEFDIAVIRLNHISNFTDFDTFEQLEEVSVRYITDSRELGSPDMIILPGSKNTLADLRAIKECGLGSSIIERAKSGTCIFGICGGYQMLGRKVEDPYGVEGSVDSEEGLGLLPVDTILEEEKVRTNYSGNVAGATGVLSGLGDLEVEGYEIHMGKTVPYEDISMFTSEDTGYCSGNIYGTYIHGFFDKKEIAASIIDSIARQKGKNISLDNMKNYSEYKDSQYDLLASGLRESFDMDYIYEIMGLKNDKR